MARVAIVSYDIQTIGGKSGGVAAFATRLARLLKRNGEDVTLIMTRADWEPKTVDQEWKARYQAEGIGLIEIQSPMPLPNRWPEVAPMRVSELVAPLLKNFDIVYLQDWGNAGFHFVRERQYRADQGPVCVTVLHGPSEWELSSNHKFPRLPDDLHLAYLERYAAERSDFVASPSRYMVEQLRGLGWKYPSEPAVLGLPMEAPKTASVSDGEIKRVVYFGRVEERKGIRLFVQAMERVAKATARRPEVILLGDSQDAELLAASMKALKGAGFAASHKSKLYSEQALKWLGDHAAETLCVVPSPSDNFPYTVVEASLVPGLNLVACRGGGVPEILGNAEAQLSAPHARELAEKILERLQAPLADDALAHYDCDAANARWLAFHRAALAAPRARRDLPAAVPTVDVCTTYYNKAEYLPQFMDALEAQTAKDFSVYAIDDGSPEARAVAVFEEQAKRGAAHGWTFVRQANAFVDAARNHAARLGSGELLLFVDSDDVPARHAVERMREAMMRSGADALICSSYLFASAKMPYKLDTGEITAESYATCVPLGMDLVGNLLDPGAFGGSMFMVKRTAYEAVGGFSEMHGAGHEDWELYARLSLAGFRVDVLPEMLQFYRQVEGSLARTLPSEGSKKRLLAPYEATLSTVGLSGAATALLGLYTNTRRTEERIATLEARMKAPGEGFAFFSGHTRSFEPEIRGLNMKRLQQWYREALPMETRLKIHRRFLAPFLGPYEPPKA